MPHTPILPHTAPYRRIPPYTYRNRGIYVESTQNRPKPGYIGGSPRFTITYRGFWLYGGHYTYFHCEHRFFSYREL